jgi:hypothetical protein
MGVSKKFGAELYDNFLSIYIWRNVNMNQIILWFYSTFKESFFFLNRRIQQISSMVKKKILCLFFTIKKKNAYHSIFLVFKPMVNFLSWARTVHRTLFREKLCKRPDSSVCRATEQYSKGPGFEPRSSCTFF